MCVCHGGTCVHQRACALYTKEYEPAVELLTEASRVRWLGSRARVTCNDVIVQRRRHTPRRRSSRKPPLGPPLGPQVIKEHPNIADPYHTLGLLHEAMGGAGEGVAEGWASLEHRSLGAVGVPCCCAVEVCAGGVRWRSAWGGKVALVALRRAQRVPPPKPPYLHLQPCQPTTTTVPQPARPVRARATHQAPLSHGHLLHAQL